jgi:hypothetical protein
VVRADPPIAANFMLECRLTLNQHTILMPKV